MSGIIVGLVMRTPVTAEFSKDTKFVAMIYAEHAWPDGSHAFPAVETVAGFIGCSARSVQRHVKVLVEMGMLIPTGVGPRGTNSYKFPLATLPDGSARLDLQGKRGDTVSPQQIVTGGGDTDSGDTDSGDTDSGDTGVTRIKEETVIKDSSSTSSSAGEKKVEPKKEEPTERPNIFKRYEENIGMLTPMIADRLREAEKEYPAKWIEYAFGEAVAHNKRSWKYIETILKRIKVEGFGDKPHDSKLPANKQPATRPTGQANHTAGSAPATDQSRAAADRINARRARQRAEA